MRRDPALRENPTECDAPSLHELCGRRALEGHSKDPSGLFGYDPTIFDHAVRRSTRLFYNTRQMGCGTHPPSWVWKGCLRELLMGYRRLVVPLLLSNRAEVETDVMNRFKGAGSVLVVLQGLQLEANCTREAMMNRFGSAFRRWCRVKKEEMPPVTWNLHLINRGESDAKSTYPELDSNVKACHTKPIMFFLSELASEVHKHVQSASLCL